MWPFTEERFLGEGPLSLVEALHQTRGVPSLLSLPLVLAQGLYVRLTTRGAPPAGGPTTGVAPAPDGGEDEPVRLGVVGESTAAGCGAATHDEGFAGSLARSLAQACGRAVEWTVVGLDGATARRTLADLAPQVPRDLDLVVVLLGVNDVLTQRPPTRWRQDLTELLDDLEGRAERVVLAGTPPFTAFPSLPGALGRYLASTGARLDAESAALAGQRPAVTFLPLDDVLDPTGPDFFCADRFHPSAHGYATWAQAVAGRVVGEGLVG